MRCACDKDKGDKTSCPCEQPLFERNDARCRHLHRIFKAFGFQRGSLYRRCLTYFSALSFLTTAAFLVALGFAASRAVEGTVLRESAGGDVVVIIAYTSAWCLSSLLAYSAMNTIAEHESDYDLATDDQRHHPRGARPTSPKGEVASLARPVSQQLDALAHGINHEVVGYKVLNCTIGAMAGTCLHVGVTAGQFWDIWDPRGDAPWGWRIAAYASFPGVIIGALLLSHGIALWALHTILLRLRINATLYRSRSLSNDRSDETKERTREESEERAREETRENSGDSIEDTGEGKVHIGAGRAWSSCESYDSDDSRYYSKRSFGALGNGSGARDAVDEGLARLSRDMDMHRGNAERLRALCKSWAVVFALGVTTLAGIASLLILRYLDSDILVKIARGEKKRLIREGLYLTASLFMGGLFLLILHYAGAVSRSFEAMRESVAGMTLDDIYAAPGESRGPIGALRIQIMHSYLTTLDAGYDVFGVRIRRDMVNAIVLGVFPVAINVAGQAIRIWHDERGVN